MVTKFRFRIERAGHLSGTGVWLVDGRLEFGKITNGSTAFAETASGKKIEVKIRNRAIVDPPSADRTRIALVIDKPPCSVEELEGSLLIGAERTTDSASEPSTAKKTVGGS